MLKKNLPVLLVVVLLTTIGCNEVPRTGIIKDVTSHITTSYFNIRPEEVFIYMNEEKCHHNQIPLGYDFQLVNNNISGLTVRDGKVSVNGSMQIADKKGNILLNEPDLFGSNNVFDKDSISFLKSAISTGKPMEYGQLYDVTVKFWDNFGEGTLENRLEIEIIDIP